jgi:hypothetical protein
MFSTFLEEIVLRSASTGGNGPLKPATFPYICLSL